MNTTTEELTKRLPEYYETVRIGLTLFDKIILGRQPKNLEILRGGYLERLDLRTSSEPQSISSSTGLGERLKMLFGNSWRDVSLDLWPVFWIIELRTLPISLEVISQSIILIPYWIGKARNKI